MGTRVKGEQIDEREKKKRKVKRKIRPFPLVASVYTKQRHYYNPFAPCAHVCTQKNADS